MFSKESIESAITQKDGHAAEQSSPHATERLNIVGIGASAGGLEALERFFKAMPADSGMAFVVIQHLSPDFKSLMDELLARDTTMPIHRVENGMSVEPNSIYLIPPKKEMIISGGRLLLTDKDPEQDLSLPIDHFFRSLAQDAGRCAVAIVLSGTGSDGSRGIRDVHEAGGLVIAQSEETAKFDGMPKSARDTGVVDCVLTPEEMPKALITHVNRPRAGNVCDETANRYLGAVHGVDAIFRLLRNEYGIDFSYYKPNTVSRRIERRLSLNQSIDLDDYVSRLSSDAGELNSLYRDLLIGVTRFFRDGEAFGRLEKDILLDLLTKKRAQEELRIWVAGCATGEEAYSLAILLHERLETLGRPINVKVFASDVHQASLETASAGVYGADALAEVTPGRLDRYFTKKSDGYHVSADLRKMIVFARHNVIKDTPFTKLDLIACRNLLIYFQPAAQKKVLSLFHFGLRTGGVLFLGPSESPGELAPEFESLDEHWKIYRKRRDIRLPADMRLPLSTPSAPVRSPVAYTVGSPFDAPLLGAYDQLLDDHMPPGFLVTAERQLVHSFQGAARFLYHRDGRPTTDILDLVDGDLKLALAGALQRAGKDHKPVVYTGVRLKSADNEEQFRLTVKPILNRHGNLTHLSITLESLGVTAAAPQAETEIDANQASREHVSSLETELRYTRENLQATIEELETSNEELQATNEELVASNEELQSTNEELHSVNEELYTVNAEYQKKIAELTELTDDMDNLLRSTDIGTIFLDHKLLIRKFTPQIGRVFDLLPQDVGRRIDTFSHSIRYEGLLESVSAVLGGGQPIEKEVQDRYGNWYFLRILPYRSHARLDGVVLSLIDISLLKRTETRLAQMSAIVASSNDAIIGMDLDGRISTWNPGAEELYGYTADEITGRPISILQGNMAQPSWMSDVLGKLRTEEAAGHQIETICCHKNGTSLDALLSFSPVRDSNDNLVGLSVIARDITERRRAEEENRRYASALEATNRELQESIARREQAEEVAKQAVRRRDEFLAMLSHELRNPLAAVLNASVLLECKEVEDNTLREACGAIRRQSQQMARLLDDLLDVSRFTRDRIEIRKAPVDLCATAAEAIEAVRPQLEEKQLHFEAGLSDSALWVHGDPARLQQIQVNLLANAVKYTPPGGRIWFNLADDVDHAVIRVRDTGVGIPRDMQQKIFDLFVQVDHKSDVSDGMGVGLTLVRSLVELHGGCVEVSSDGPGQGSEFTVRLPLQEENGARIDTLNSSERLDGLRVLLVDDLDDIRSVTRLLLEAHGCEVFVAEDGQRGIAVFKEARPDVALIDIGMPGMNGYEVARAIRSLPIDNQTLLVAVTGYGQTQDREKALEAGFDTHLVKPINVRDLVALLGKAFPRETGAK